jgi:CheY-like chemotaxis protein
MVQLSEQAKGARSQGHRGSVLIVEDNVALGTCLEMLLEAHSYEVCRTTDGPGGLEYITLTDFDVILCDLVVPGFTGDFLYSAVQRFKPRQCDRFIFMSGHAENQKWSDFASSTNRPFLAKPFEVNVLLEAIERMVNANALQQHPGGASSEISSTAGSAA